jgi:hypothetical protein
MPPPPPLPHLESSNKSDKSFRSNQSNRSTQEDGKPVCSVILATRAAWGRESLRLTRNHPGPQDEELVWIMASQVWGFNFSPERDHTRKSPQNWLHA